MLLSTPSTLAIRPKKTLGVKMRRNNSYNTANLTLSQPNHHNNHNNQLQPSNCGSNASIPITSFFSQIDKSKSSSFKIYQDIEISPTPSTNQHNHPNHNHNQHHDYNKLKLDKENSHPNIQAINYLPLDKPLLSRKASVPVPLFKLTPATAEEEILLPVRSLSMSSDHSANEGIEDYCDEDAQTQQIHPTPLSQPVFLRRGSSLSSCRPITIAPHITVNTNIDSLNSGDFVDYCTPVNQGVKERSDSNLKVELMNNRTNNLIPHYNPQQAPKKVKLQNHMNESNSNTFSMVALSQSLTDVEGNSHLAEELSGAAELDEPMINPFLPIDLNDLNNPLSAGKTRKRASLQPDNSRFNNDFMYLSSLGSGSFGEVILCKHRLDGCNYAIKRLKKKIAPAHQNNRNSKQKQYLLHEVFGWSAVQSNLTCSNIVRYHSAWIEGGTIYIQSEYCKHGSLASKLKSGHQFTEEELIRILSHIAQALNHLHSLGFAHLDLKPDNILIAEEEVYKLCDLGLISRMSCSAQSVHSLGDKRYLPSEALENEDKLNDLDKIDMFSLGVTLYELGSNIPLTSSELELTKLRHGDLSKFSSRVQNKVLNELLRNLLHYEPKERVTAQQLIQLLQPFSAQQRIAHLEKELAELKQKFNHPPHQPGSNSHGQRSG
jgi:hypothetical protein